MFETQQFRDQLNEVVSSEAGNNLMDRYQTAVVDFLFAQARDNENALMPVEMKKSLGERRGIPDALQSARTLVRDASIIAHRENQGVLTRAHLKQAYKAKYCRVWPFCK